MPSKVVFDADTSRRCGFDEFSPWAAWDARETAYGVDVAWTYAYRLYVERSIVWELTIALAGRHGLLNDQQRENDDAEKRAG